MFKKAYTATLGDLEVSQKGEWHMEFKDGSTLPLKTELLAYLLKRKPKSQEKQSETAPLIVPPPPKDLTVKKNGVPLEPALSLVERNVQEINDLRVRRAREQT